MKFRSFGDSTSSRVKDKLKTIRRFEVEDITAIVAMITSTLQAVSVLYVYIESTINRTVLDAADTVVPVNNRLVP